MPIETDDMTIKSKSGEKKYRVCGDNVVVPLRREHDIDLETNVCVLCGKTGPEIIDELLSGKCTVCKPEERPNEHTG